MQVIKFGETSQTSEERGKVSDMFLKEFEQNREGVLTDALGKLADLLPSKVYPRVWDDINKRLSIQGQIKLHLNRFMRSRVIDLIGEGLVTTSPQEWHDLTTFVENQAHLNATTFDVSDPIHIDGLISVMQIMVPFYKRGVQSNLVRDFVNIHVLPQFHKLLEDRKLDFLKALAEISFFTRAPVSNHTLRSMGEILKMYMPSSSKGSAFNVEKSSTHVECILYVFHHLAHKAENTKTATELCKQLRERLKNVTLMTSPRLEELRINLSNDDKELRGLQDGLGTLSSLRK